MISLINVAGNGARASRIERKSSRDISAKVLHLERKPGRILRSKAGSTKIALLSVSFCIVMGVFLCGVVYLYQVNDLATKGFEIQELDQRIQNLEKDHKKMEIRETELRSMYHLEQTTQDLNLVNPKDITYLEIDGPVAMK